eukprot:2230441-Rhodomonas_salina.2
MPRHATRGRRASHATRATHATSTQEPHHNHARVRPPSHTAGVAAVEVVAGADGGDKVLGELARVLGVAEHRRHEACHAPAPASPHTLLGRRGAGERGGLTRLAGVGSVGEGRLRDAAASRARSRGRRRHLHLR